MSLPDPLPFIPSAKPQADLMASAAALYIQSQSGWPTANLTTADTHVLAEGPGVFHAVTVNTPDSGATVAVYDGEDATGVLLATIDAGTAGGTYVYDAAFSTGLAVVVTGTPDVTVAYRAG